MKTSEIMLGDYFNVYPSNLPIKVAAIHKGKVGYHARKDRLAWVRADLLRPIPLTPEILEKNGFKKDAFTNLSPDYYLGNDEYSICINLNSTCDKSKSVWVEKRSSRFTVGIEESRHSLDKKPLYVHQLQHALRLCGIDKTIEI